MTRPFFWQQTYHKLHHYRRIPDSSGHHDIPLLVSIFVITGCIQMDFLRDFACLSPFLRYIYIFSPISEKSSWSLIRFPFIKLTRFPTNYTDYLNSLSTLTSFASTSGIAGSKSTWPDFRTVPSSGTTSNTEWWSSWSRTTCRFLQADWRVTAGCSSFRNALALQSLQKCRSCNARCAIRCHTPTCADSAHRMLWNQNHLNYHSTQFYDTSTLFSTFAAVFSIARWIR